MSSSFVLASLFLLFCARPKHDEGGAETGPVNDDTDVDTDTLQPVPAITAATNIWQTSIVGHVCSVAWAPDGSWFAAVAGCYGTGYDGQLGAWYTDGTARFEPFQVCNSFARDVEISPDGQAIAVGCEYDNEVYVHDAEDGSAIAAPSCLGSNGVNGVAWHPGGGSLVATGSPSSMGHPELCQFSTSSWEGLLEQTIDEGDLNDLAFSDNGEWLVVAGFEDVYLYNASPLYSLATLSLGQDWVFMGKVTVYPPGDYFALTGPAEDYVWLGQRSARDLSKWLQVSPGVYDLHFGPDGGFLALAMEDGTVGIFDLEDLVWEIEMQPHAEPARAVRFSPDGRYLLSGGGAPTLILWELERAE